MHRAEHPEIMWGLGLDQDTAAVIEQNAGPGFSLRNLPADAAAWMRGQEGQSQAAWIPEAVWRDMPKSRRKACRAMDSLRRILVLEESAESLETEAVLAEGFLTAVRAPLTRYKVRDALLRVRELDSLSADLRRKTEEIMLERELLSRKSNHLSFLNRMLSRATASLDAATILSKARTDLRHLLPVTVLSAVFWSRAANGPGLEAELYLHCLTGPEQSAAWQEVLLSAAESLGGAKVAENRQICLTPGPHARPIPLPTDGKLLMSDGTNAYPLGVVALTRPVKNSVTNGSVTFAWAATTITRSAGSWLTDGYKVGDLPIIQNAPDAANNLLGTQAITSLTDTVMTLGGASMTARAATYGQTSVALADNTPACTDLLAATALSGLIGHDAAGNHLLELPKGWKLQAALVTAPTSGKTVNVRAHWGVYAAA